MRNVQYLIGQTVRTRPNVSYPVNEMVPHYEERIVQANELWGTIILKTETGRLLKVTPQPDCGCDFCQTTR